jgi:hypothetical protein
MELFAPNQKLIIQKHEKLTISSEKKIGKFNIYTTKYLTNHFSSYKNLKQVAKKLFDLMIVFYQYFVPLRIKKIFFPKIKLEKPLFISQPKRIK